MQVPNIDFIIKTALQAESEVKYPAKKILLDEGEISTKMFFVKSGALREYFYQDGRELTLEFITEGQAVASFESFLNGTKSQFIIETLEPTIVYELEAESFRELINNQSFQQTFNPLFYQRFGEITQRLMSFIKDSPQKRYEDLLKDRPELLLRFPQHYIASYLGITSVSLSRIRNRR
ncbi:Crp/Fnr family transcriptional regulator [Chryseobacterium sp. PMSZPI]|uniref:Crp/Fnr family transcriptional regulator n=1 Tax=Chryseobacterium sp. PMSZPI TaxID=1033900 RepID=UPI000C349CD6|nr:Crp/Fnr family transcriptional regulator [Chryseobacterium sp. PMSZPI]PKF73654.1 Crp/Fnr family transcriptional regulator [Chryseobacterium sp. PMSZPI]